MGGSRCSLFIRLSGTPIIITIFGHHDPCQNTKIKFFLSKFDYWLVCKGLLHAKHIDTVLMQLSGLQASGVGDEAVV